MESVSALARISAPDGLFCWVCCDMAAGFTSLTVLAESLAADFAHGFMALRMALRKACGWPTSGCLRLCCLLVLLSIDSMKR